MPAKAAKTDVPPPPPSDPPEPLAPRHGIGYRHLQIAFMFTCLTLCIAMRVNFSISIVAMTKQESSSNPSIPVFEWDNCSIMLSAFFWGYIVLQIVTGYLSKIYGAKYVLLINFFTNTLAFILIPWFAVWGGSYAVIFLRFVQGLGQGCILPCAHTVLGKWAPTSERILLGLLVYSGLSFGAILSLSISGYLCSSWIGWPSSFYLFGAAGLLWCVVYFFLGASSPATHKLISIEEKDYIEASLGQNTNQKDPPVPWLSILKCIHFWAVVSGNIGSAWTYTLLMAQVPSYLAYVMHFDLESNGLISAIPYLTCFLTGLVAATVADVLIVHNCISRLNARRIFQLSGACGVGLFLMLLGYTDQSKPLSVAYLAFAKGFYSFTLVGHSINHVDLSPRFAGLMQGISNTISQSIGVFGPLSVQWIVRDKENADHWRIVFLLVSVIFIVSALFYAIFTSVTRQEWDSPLEDEPRPPRTSIAILAETGSVTM